MRKMIKQHDILCVTPAMKRYICSHMKKTKQIYETAMKEGAVFRRLPNGNVICLMHWKKEIWNIVG